MNKYLNKLLLAFLLLIPMILLTSCGEKVPNTPSYKTSKSLPKYDQDSFDDYLIQTKQWIKNNRYFLSDDKQNELKANMPFELKPTRDTKLKNSNKAILLVQGLSDSPGYFKDISKVFANKGFLVRTILLPGHGTKAADLILASKEDWVKKVAHHINLLKKQNKEVWLGGFSTGANLVTSYALKDKSIKGLCLFSPAFYARSSLIGFIPIVSYFKTWLDIDDENDIYKYQSMPTHGINLYYKTSRQVQEDFENTNFDRPAFFVLSKDDSVVNYQKTIDIFKNKFTNKSSKFLLYANEKEVDKTIINDKRIKVYNSNRPDLQISNFSHMSILFSKTNPHYGKDGSYLMLNNGQEDKVFTNKANTWYSSWGTNKDGLYHARLTWNPYFKELSEEIKQFGSNE
ncbi:MAG: Thermostable monoacylglycerol lipase [Arcobacter lacus]|nr:MAG: Thermostable monoacylglycerol lipase [Arcobacter lacus]